MPSLQKTICDVPAGAGAKEEAKELGCLSSWLSPDCLNKICSFPSRFYDDEDRKTQTSEGCLNCLLRSAAEPGALCGAGGQMVLWRCGVLALALSVPSSAVVYRVVQVQSQRCSAAGVGGACLEDR